MRAIINKRMNLVDATDSDVKIAEAHLAQTERQQRAGLGLLWDLQASAAILALLHLQGLFDVRGAHIHSGGAILVGVHFLLSMAIVVLLTSFSSRLLNPHLRFRGDVEPFLLLLVVLFPLIVCIASVAFASFTAVAIVS